MNVTLPKKEKISKRRLAIYIIIIAICVIAIIVAVCIQILGNDFTNKIFGVNKLKAKTEEEEQLLRNNFDNIFSNGLQIQDELTTDITKIDNNSDYVITNYSNNEKVIGSYELNVNIPYINIDNDIIKQYNEEIKSIFTEKAQSILETKNQNYIYSVEYQAYIENNILSLIIRSNLKQGANAQQLVIQTYNFDLINKKEITLNDEIETLDLDKEEVQKQIRNEVKKEQEKAEDLSELGYDIYRRDSESDYYLIDNSNIFFLHEQNLYIIYPYGNNALTTEMDIVII